MFANQIATPTQANKPIIKERLSQSISNKEHFEAFSGKKKRKCYQILLNMSARRKGTMKLIMCSLIKQKRPGNIAVDNSETKDPVPEKQGEKVKVIMIVI